MTRNRWIAVVVLATAALVAVAAILVRQPVPETVEPPVPRPAPTLIPDRRPAPAKSVEPAATNAARRLKGWRERRAEARTRGKRFRPKGQEKREPKDWFDGYPASVSEPAKRLQKALDEEDYATVKALAAELAGHSEVELRRHAAEALCDCGSSALASLARFLDDADEETSETAVRGFSMAMDDIENEDAKVGLLEDVFKTIGNRNTLEVLSADFATLDAKKSVDALVRIISSSNKEGISAAKEAYESVTGEEYTTPAAARQWLKENYEPPEEEE